VIRRGLSESEVKEILASAEKLPEDEKKLIQELREYTRYYYLGYLPVTYRVKINV